jgi:hypothetical protein
MGIEPTSKAWEAFVLPLNYTRFGDEFYDSRSVLRTRAFVLPLGGDCVIASNLGKYVFLMK